MDQVGSNLWSLDARIASAVRAVWVIFKMDGHDEYKPTGYYRAGGINA